MANLYRLGHTLLSDQPDDNSKYLYNKTRSSPPRCWIWLSPEAPNSSPCIETWIHLMKTGMNSMILEGHHPATDSDRVQGYFSAPIPLPPSFSQTFHLPLFQKCLHLDRRSWAPCILLWPSHQPHLAAWFYSEERSIGLSWRLYIWCEWRRWWWLRTPGGCHTFPRTQGLREWPDSGWYCSLVGAGPIQPSFRPDGMSP